MIVTPEAVPLDFEVAHIGSRFVALLLDLAIIYGGLTLLVLALGWLGADALDVAPDWLGATVVILLVFVLRWGYPVGMETLWGGRTLGKAAMGLRVVTVEGGPVGVRHAAIRGAIGLVDFELTGGFAAVLSAVLTRRHQRLGDLAAGTLVVRERTGAGPPTAVRFEVPRGAESYAATLDVSGLDADDYRAIRQFLLRASRLDPSSRARVATTLATPVAQRLRHRPPEGTSAETFLRCVAARYQQRGTAAPGTAAPGAAPGTPMASGSDRDFAPPW